MPLAEGIINGSKNEIAPKVSPTTNPAAGLQQPFALRSRISGDQREQSSRAPRRWLLSR